MNEHPAMQSRPLPALTDSELSNVSPKFPRPPGPLDTSAAAYAHSWAATRDVFIAACREALFFGLATGAVKVEVGSDREPSIKLSWADTPVGSRGTPASRYESNPDYQRSLFEAAERQTLLALLDRPSEGVSAVEVGKAACIPGDLLHDVLHRAEARGLLTAGTDMVVRLTHGGENLATCYKSKANSSQMGFGR